MNDLLRTLARRLDNVRLWRRADLSAQDATILRAVRPFTMTSLERLVALIDAVRHVVRENVPGDLAECGVWRGGSMMAAALVLAAENDTARHLYLYDTFEGMSAPTAADTDCNGVPAADRFRGAARAGGWCRCGLEEVRANLFSTGYPKDRIHFVKGKVEDTIPGTAPESLALLRLDTDWYESTRHELDHLFPRLSPRGLLILDDYGHWQGARKAADEYFAAHAPGPYLHRIDYTGRVAQKL